MRSLHAASDATAAPPPPAADRPGPAAIRSKRTPADVDALLFELARANRGFAYYGETDARRGPLAERAHLAARAELERGGPLILLLPDDDGIRLASGESVGEPRGPVADLEAALRRHGLTRLELSADLTATALAGLLDLIGRGTDRFPTPEHLARTLAARDTAGIVLNDLCFETRSGPPPLETTPPRASIALAHLDPETTAPMFPVADAPDEAPGHAGDESPKPSLDAAPLAAPSSDDRGERLRARLIELDASTDDADYCNRVEDIAIWTEELCKEGLTDEGYRSMRVLADHAIGGGGRSEVQARAADAGFRRLAVGDRLDDLIQRAAAAGVAGGGVRAAQLLLQLGESAMPALMDQLCREGDEARSATLRALILTQGEAALGPVLAAIRSHDARRASLGIRLAGEIQNPVVLPALIDSLRAPDLTRRLETIRSLSLLPGEESRQALSDALASDLEEIASAAGEALATADGHAAVPVLLDVLDASAHSARTQLSCTLVETLGRLGDERAVPRLAAILERRPVLRRAHWHALQLVTIDALAVLPTKEARRSIQRAALHGPQSIRARARAALDRIADPR